MYPMRFELGSTHEAIADALVFPKTLSHLSKLHFETRNVIGALKRNGRIEEWEIWDSEKMG